MNRQEFKEFMKEGKELYDVMKKHYYEDLKDVVEDTSKMFENYDVAEKILYGNALLNQEAALAIFSKFDNLDEDLEKFDDVLRPLSNMQTRFSEMECAIQKAKETDWKRRIMR